MIGSRMPDPRSTSWVLARSDVAISDGWLAISKSPVTVVPAVTLNTSVCVATAFGASALGPSVRNGRPSA